MAATMELESLILRIIGDNSSAVSSLKEVQQHIEQAEQTLKTYNAQARAFGRSGGMGGGGRGMGSHVPPYMRAEMEHQKKLAEAADVEMNRTLDRVNTRGKHLERGRQQETKKKKELEEFNAKQRQQWAAERKQMDELDKQRRSSHERKFVNQELDAVNAGKKELETARKAAAGRQTLLDQELAKRKNTANTERQQKLNEYNDREKKLAKALEKEAKLKDVEAAKDRARRIKDSQDLYRQTERQNKEKLRQSQALQRQQLRDRERHRVEAERNAQQRNLGMVVGGTAAAAGVGMFGAGVMSGLEQSVEEYGRFNLAIVESTSIMKVNEKQQQRMEKQAMELAKHGPQSAAELAKAYYYLGSAGLDAEASIAALPQVQAFATAGAFQLEKATTLALTAMAAIGLKSNDAAENLKNLTRVTDTLIQANIISDATTEQMAQSFTKQAGAALRSFNKTIEEGAAILAVYAEQGDKGVTAGTHLSMVLRHLSEQAIKHKSEYEKMGIAVYDASGNMRKMWDIVKDLEKSLGKMNDQNRVAALLRLGFQAKLQQSILPLIGTSEKMKENYDLIMGGRGATKQVQEKQMTAFINQMKVTANIAKNAAIVLGEALAPAWLAVGQAMAGVFNWFTTLDKSIIKLVADIALMVGATALVTASILGVAVALGAVALVTGGWGLVALVAFAGATLAVGVALGLLVNGAGGAGKVLKDLAQWFQEVWKEMLPIRMALDDFSKVLVKSLKTAFTEIKGMMANLWQSLGGGSVQWKDVIDFVVDGIIFMEYYLENFKGMWGVTWAFVKFKSLESFNFVTRNFLAFTGLLGAGIVAMDGNWGNFFQRIRQGSGETFLDMGKQVQTLGKLFQAVLTGNWTAVGAEYANLQNQIFNTQKGTPKFKLTRFGFEIGNMKELEEEARQEYERLNGVIGTDSKAWKEYWSKRKLEIEMKVKERSSKNFLNDLLGGALNADKITNAAKNAQRGMENFAPGDFLQNQKVKLDAAAYGSAEALTRMEEQFNRIYRDQRDLENEQGRMQVDVGDQGGNFAGNFVTPALTEAIVNLTRSTEQLVENNKRPVVVDPANFPGI